ncbi:unnamed protein product [Candidula unifasciata]|uniref:Biotin-protein ligase N-terminal domain-containing protein n=1 Tax=Candidula unifasciata TaxID=100452 RepID=A0A8S3ZAT5_9EUPU|nr:unnamed protein product [Candidula unifasciata]
MARGSVLVYKGLGASETGYSHLMTALRSCVDLNKQDIDFVTPEEIVKGTKLDKASLVAFGAGYTSGFASALGEEGMRNVRNHILRGHAYLGLGAGGYFGCDYVEFDKGGPHEKLVERDLRFYPGVCSGPVYPGFQYGTHKGLHAASVDFSSEYFSGTFHAMIDGGGKFCSSDPPKPGSLARDVVDVATFSDLPESPPAIVKTTLKDNGLVVLSNVHLEYDMISLLDLNPELEHLREKFVQSRLSQLSAFRSLLQMLNVAVI